MNDKFYRYGAYTPSDQARMVLVRDLTIEILKPLSRCLRTYLLNEQMSARRPAVNQRLLQVLKLKFHPESATTIVFNSKKCDRMSRPSRYLSDIKFYTMDSRRIPATPMSSDNNTHIQGIPKESRTL